MATQLSPAHRSWRTKVFVATWLSYVGFYFCRKPWNATKAAIQAQNHWDAATVGNIGAVYLIAYAIGQFLASSMGPRLGPRRNVLIGMAASIVVTIAMGVTLSPWMMGGLIFVLGLSQATGWSGNVGTMANWFHKHERGRVMGVWSTNFTVGSLASAWIFGLVLGDLDPKEQPWQTCFYVGAGVLTIVWLQFYYLQRTRPEDVGLVPIDDPETSIDESRIREPEKIVLNRDQWTNLLLIGGFYFFVKLVRYAIWDWAAYFLEVKYGLKGKDANIYSTAFDVCGIPGVYVTGWLSDRFFGSRRGEVALIMMIGMTAATGLLMAFGGSGVVVFTVLLGVVGFFLFGPDALLTGAGAMDIGNRRTATFAAAVISGFGSLGPVAQEVIIPRVYDQKTAGLGPMFAILFVSAAAAAVFCGVLVGRNRRGGKGI
jgi:OPA family sugar phosphate sensor protein UhpC-like MFS transporter